MRLEVQYEWDLETVTTVDSEDHDAGEVLDHDHSDTFPGFNQPEEDGERVVTVLVRDVGNEDRGLVDRSWAYLTDDGELPAHFTQPHYNERTGEFYERIVAPVPKRFHDEIKKFRKSCQKV